MNAKTKKASKATTKKASAKAPKAKPKKTAKAATLTRPANRIMWLVAIIESLPDRMLRDLARTHGTPIKKVKDETAAELARKFVENKTPITIGIG